jgi:hypothetical protein
MSVDAKFMIMQYSITYSVECQKTPEFDTSVEVPEGDVDGDKHNVGWVAEEVAPKLDSLAEDKSPQCQGDKEGLSLFGWPRLRCFVPRVEDEAVVRECPCGDSRLEYGISAPWLGPALELVSGRQLAQIDFNAYHQ